MRSDDISNFWNYSIGSFIRGGTAINMFQLFEIQFNQNDKVDIVTFLMLSTKIQFVSSWNYLKQFHCNGTIGQKQ